VAAVVANLNDSNRFASVECVLDLVVPDEALRKADPQTAARRRFHRINDLR
jgi:hypothetical protein